MEQSKILNFCLEKGILLDKEVLNMFSESVDFESAKLIIEKIRQQTQRKLITKEVFNNKEQMNNLFSALSEDKKEKLKIKLGLEVEISREISSNSSQKSNIYEIKENNTDKIENNIQNFGKVKVESFISNLSNKPEVEDFVKYFRNRFSKLRDILHSHPNLKNLVSINKISGNRQGISLIGLVSDKKVTKNGNVLLELEDLTGKIRVLINKNREELYEKSEDITLDSVIAVRGSGNNEILFANEVIFPDSVVLERKKAPKEEHVLFIGDLHYGSKLFLEKSFMKFVDYLNGNIPNTPEVDKIKYLFIVGDIVSGVGIYPGQEKGLKFNDLEEQFKGIANLLDKIRKDITIVICPGNHDGVRLMEPQPIFDEKYAWPIYELNNVIVTTNPSYVNIGAEGSFSGFDVLLYHGFSYPYYADNISKLIKADAINSPDKIMAYLLKNRHLAPTHTSVQYYPMEEDPLVINKVPDVLLSGHTHKCAVSYYNNILLVSTAAWEAKTEYQERLGNEPDFCKVPIMNLKSRAIKILDFEDIEENKEKSEVDI